MPSTKATNSSKCSRPRSRLDSINKGAHPLAGSVFWCPGCHYTSPRFENDLVVKIICPCGNRMRPVLVADIAGLEQPVRVNSHDRKPNPVGVELLRMLILE
jgi:hypothetical protein